MSADFIASTIYCWEIEMKRAIERGSAGSALVAPVIIRPCLWNETLLATKRGLKSPKASALAK